MNTQGDRRRDCRANDRVMYSPYYALHDGRTAWIKEHSVDNAVELDGQLWCARQPEVQSKVDTPPATASEAAVKAEHKLNLARQIGKIATRIDRRFLAISDAL